jgi:predicted CoA-substrate-specific enzyme activase
VILKDYEITAHGTFVIAGPVDTAAKDAYERALKKAGLIPDRIQRLFATGVGRENIPFVNGHVTEMSSHAKGAHFTFPNARTVIDIGAEGTRILRCDEAGNLTNFLLNDKCASGTGVFLETVAEMMQIPLEDMGSLSLKSASAVTLTSTCAVFAESEIVAEVHRGAAVEDILMGVNESIASKIKLSSTRVGIAPELVVTGGVGRNVGVVEALARQFGLDIKVPEHPEIAGALGAAILAGGRLD